MSHEDKIKDAVKDLIDTMDKNKVLYAILLLVAYAAAEAEADAQ